MSLVTIEHPSGFAHLSVEAVGDSDEPEKIEVNDDSTVLYYNDLAEAVAASVCLTKVQPVENPKPVYITVQDYYDPDAESSTEVQLRDLQKVGLRDHWRFFVHRLGYNELDPMKYDRKTLSTFLALGIGDRFEVFDDPAWIAKHSDIFATR